MEVRTVNMLGVNLSCGELFFFFFFSGSRVVLPSRPDVTAVKVRSGAPHMRTVAANTRVTATKVRTGSAGKGRVSSAGSTKNGPISVMKKHQMKAAPTTELAGTIHDRKICVSLFSPVRS